MYNAEASLPNRPLSRDERWKLLGQQGATVWFTGLPGAGKSTLSEQVEIRLLQRGVYCFRLDGDSLRQGLNADLGFSPQDRAENVRRLCEVSLLASNSGCVSIVAAISPYAADRARCRQRHEQAGIAFLEVFVDTPPNVCEQRDPKGLYQKARAGLISNFTGIDAPYEAPSAPDVTLRTTELDVASCVGLILEALTEKALVSNP